MGDGGLNAARIYIRVDNMALRHSAHERASNETVKLSDPCPHVVLPRPV